MAGPGLCVSPVGAGKRRKRGRGVQGYVRRRPLWSGLLALATHKKARSKPRFFEFHEPGDQLAAASVAWAAWAGARVFFSVMRAFLPRSSRR